MQPAEAVSRSALEKPVHLLTEGDIAKLTGEDCRRFLKQKGMRRPSWNKSQAIQQVISLKALLETTSDSASTDQENPNHGHSDPDAPESIANPDVSPGDDIAAPQIESVSSCTMDVTKEQMGQMTIFYSGKVSVFDDISWEKSRLLMQLAASPLFLPRATPSEVITALWPFHSHLQAAAIQLGSASPTVIFPKLQTEKDQVHRAGNDKSVEGNRGPASRKASVRRYLEKKKDRFKHKRKVAAPCSACLDIYLNNVVGDQFPTMQLNPTDANSPPNPGPLRRLPGATQSEITIIMKKIFKGAENGDR